MRVMRFVRGAAWIALGAAGFATLLAASRGDRETVKPGQVEMVVWANPTGPEEEAFKELCRRFQASHPNVALRITGGVDPIRLIRAIVAGAPPDLAYLYGPQPVGPLAANHAVRPLDTYFRQAGFKETDFLPGAIAQGSYKGHIYALPTTRDSRALYWNRQCFRNAGLNPDHPPQTLSELMTMARKLTRRDAQGRLVQLGMLLPEGMHAFAIFGGGVSDMKTGKITANRPENIAALRWLVQLADMQGGYRAISAFVAGFGSDVSTQNPLAIGKVAMKLDGEWASMHMDRYAPGADYKVGEIPYPDGRPDLKNMAWQDGDFMYIPNGSRHPEIAWEFIRWLQEPAQQKFYSTAFCNLPTIMALRNSPHFQQGPRQLRVVGYIMSHIASNEQNAHFVPALPVSQMYESVLKDAFDRALFHDKTPEQALNDAQARVEREMRRYE